MTIIKLYYVDGINVVYFFLGFPLLKKKEVPYCTASAVNFEKIIVSLKKLL